MQSSEAINSLSKVLFWDVNPDLLDVNKNAAYIVQRVLTLGTLNDFRAIKSLYGMNRLHEIVIGLRTLDDKTLHFCSVYFSTPIQEFRCYKERQLNQAHWNY
ncbi:MAG: hypothetical protein ABI851_06895 [Saprospiraceae bacterium]